MQRRGTSLMEVLIAIFILALGLVSLLTLFPIGLVQMAKSVQDERAAELAGNAASYMRMLWKDACEASARDTPGGQPLFTDPKSLYSFWSAMDDPNLNFYELTYGAATNTINPTIVDPKVFPVASVNTIDAGMSSLRTQASFSRASYPVYVDPIGWEANAGSGQQFWMGYLAIGNPTGPSRYRIPRRRIPQVAVITDPLVPVVRNINPAFEYKKSALRNCMLLDDMSYSPDGVAIPSERQMQFSCAWLLRRDNNNKRTETNVTVVVYHKRSIESPSDEATFLASVAPSTIGSAPNQEVVFPNTLTLNYTTANRPALRRGSWILDATMDGVTPTPLPNDANANRLREAQGFYYRVADFTETEVSTGNFQNVLQLETRLRPRQAEITPPPGGTQPRLIIVQDRVLEVFDKGPLEMNSPNRIN